MRALQIGRALQTVGRVSVSVVSSDVTTPEVITRTGYEFALEPPVKVNVLPNRSFVHRPQRALNPRFLNVHGCIADASDRERLLKRLNDFDLIWVLNSRTPNILNQWRWPRAVLDIDDLPSAFYRTVWQNGDSLKEKLKAGIQMRLSTRRERFWKERFSVLSVCSEEDRQYLGGGEHVHVIPNGFERQAQEPRPNPTDPPRIGFIGLYSYSPNLEGMKWFVRECWPLIKQQVPDARLRLVGKDTNGPLKPNAPGIDALGYVADPADEVASWRGMIVPVTRGAGTRVKLADAFSRRCPVVSTHLGAYGYDVRNGRELLLADAPHEFAAACVSLIRDRPAASRMAERAHAAFLEKWTWDAIAPSVWAAAEDCLRRNFARSSRRSAAKHDSTQNTDTYSGSTDQFTVVIPTFNRSRLVQRAIESALGQTLRASQIIVVDDGSTDDTREVCRKYGNAIEYVRQPNSGVSTARNNGIRRVRQPWTAFLDSDDYWTPTHLERIAAAIDGTSGQARFYFSDMRIPGGTKDNTLWTKIGFQFASPFLLTPDGTAWLLSDREPCSVQTTVFNTETLKLSGGFDPRFRVTEDRELFYRLGIGSAICAVNTVGCVQTDDDNPNNRLGGIVNTYGTSYWEHESLLWTEVLSRFPRLGTSHRQAVLTSVAVTHWRLARLHMRSGRMIRCARSILQSAIAKPAFMLQVLHGGASSIFVPVLAELTASDNLEC